LQATSEKVSAENVINQQAARHPQDRGSGGVRGAASRSLSLREIIRQRLPLGSRRREFGSQPLTLCAVGVSVNG